MKKKFVALMLVAVMALAAFGCGSSSAKSASDKKQEETAEAAQKSGDTKGAAAADAKAGAETSADAASAEAASAETASTALAAADDVAAVDISDQLGDKDALKKYAGQKVVIKNAKSVDTEDPGGDLLRFLYDTDGNGDPGDDLYFSIEKDGKTYLLKIESDLCDVESEPYQMVETLEEDTMINLEGTLTGEDSPFMQVTGITITEE